MNKINEKQTKQNKTKKEEYIESNKERLKDIPNGTRLFANYESKIALKLYSYHACFQENWGKYFSAY